MVLAAAIDTVIRFVDAFFEVYLILIIAYIVSSWIPLPYNVWLNRAQRFLYDVVDPYLRLFRRILPGISLGGLGLDVSPILGTIVLIVIWRLIDQGLQAL